MAKKKNKKNKLPRNPHALDAKTRRAGPMQHKNAPKGGGGDEDLGKQIAEALEWLAKD